MKRKILKNILAAAGFLAICALVGLLVGCPVKRFLGVPCPGCGMTRGCLALLRLDFSVAFRWHPLCFLVPIFLVVYILKDLPPVRGAIRPGVLILIILLYIGVYVVRMKLYFPHTPPMDFQENSIVGEIVRHLLLH
ncbi:MAG: DUF2752 domain-containing protein [Clostridia bacterium]